MNHASSSSLPRTLPSMEDFLHVVSPEAPSGAYLRYEALYDEVRLARQEDDPRLSMGIWETDLKRAEWDKIEGLCSKALIFRSKDLQIAAWLTEAWISLDKVEGYARGITLLSGLIKAFWESIHPQPQEDGDMENRLMILEWMDKTFASRLLFVPLTSSRLDQTALGLGFFKSAQYSDANQKRAPSSPSDPAKRVGTTEEFQKSLEQTPDDFLKKSSIGIEAAIQATQNLKNSLAPLLGAASPSFPQILGILKEMGRIVQATLHARKPPLPIQPEPEKIEPREPSETHKKESGGRSFNLLEALSGTHNLKTRDDAYQHLEAIAAFLQENEPHSLVPQFLSQFIRWKDRNLLEIFQEIAKTPQEYDILMKIMGVSRDQRREKVNPENGVS